MQVFRGARDRVKSPVALTIGNFDGVHLGHQAMLKRLCDAALGLDLPAAVLTFEPHPREFFSAADAPARLTSMREKLELLEEYGVDQVHVVRFNREFAALSPEQFIEQLLVKNLRARWLLVGDDFRFGARREGDTALLQRAAPQFGFALASLISVEVAGQRVSSTGVREALANGDFARATRLLGRAYCIGGRVAHGEKLGRKLGFPTANIALKRHRTPLAGIYAVKLHGIDSNPLPGVASLGVRPTVMDAAAPVLEIHLFDFDRDIYGRRVKVEFLHKLRDEEKYNDLESLRRQIAIDVEQARHYLTKNL